VVNDKMSGTTQWQGRASDPSLEAEMLARLMVKLGAKEQEARAAVAAPTGPVSTAAAAPGAAAAATPAGPARARLVSGQPATLQVDEPFDRAWRRVGLALDRTGFTVEDRDRANGIYYVRYADPKLAGQEEPGFFSKLFGRGGDKAAPVRYRIEVQRSPGTQTLVAVKNSAGQAETGDIGQRISGLLLEDLK
jgi:outer membrane protein assembly factor BamC